MGRPDGKEAMCRVDHRAMASETLASLVAKGGGSVSKQCKKCGERFLVSYSGPMGLFTEVRNLGQGKKVIR